MKIFIQAKPQLRGPRGLREWYAQLPVATSATDEAADILPIDGLLDPLYQGAVLPDGRTLRSAWFQKKTFAGLLSLFLKKSYYKKSQHDLSTGNRVWLRHLLGMLALSLGVFGG